MEPLESSGSGGSTFHPIFRQEAPARQPGLLTREERYSSEASVR
jgi:hypothetical protein